MNRAIPLSEGIYWIGANDLETELFEAIWPLPQGVCYNSYLIKDEKVALIDTVKRGFVSQLVEKVRSVLDRGQAIDYLVINHMEPDHSGSMQILQEIFPDMRIVGNKRTLEFVQGFYGIRDKVQEVKEGDTLELGAHRLRFFLTPMVHWPETMMSLEETSATLFSGDAFGGFGALSGGIFDDEVDLPYFAGETLRYFSNIVAKYSPMVLKAIDKLSGLQIRVVASTHGPIYRRDPKYIIDKYSGWSRQVSEPGAVVVYASMYGHTQTMAESVARGLAQGGIEQIRLHNISRTHVSFILPDIWRFQGLILGSCTYNTRLFPPMDMLLSILENDRLVGKTLGVFGTYSWSGGAVKRLEEFARASGNLLVEPVVEARHSASEGQLETCRALGRSLAEKIHG